MLDQPGQRRSHSAPTPRGGGIGVVVAVLACLPGSLLWLPPSLPSATVAAASIGLVLVAAIGWWDDHHALPVLPRLAVQLAAIGLVAFAFIATGMAWAWLPLLLLAGVGSINLHNFMDGIDGLLAQQAMFVMLAMAWLAWREEQAALAAAAGVVALACVGFWVFNRAPARIFMGDVGSGAMGYLIFVIGAMLWRTDSALIWPVAILCGAFVTDAGWTLAGRMWRGRRWYSAHREHLYQWLVRKGAGHGRVGLAYAAWNVLVLAPLAWLAWHLKEQGWWVCAVSYLLTSGMWMMLKRRCLRREPYRVLYVGS
ncbi:glycosyl transferase family 4 [Dyella sp.]|uniref:glycosyl transferase family 4 n=1 Tax=Dyella sp. TaxID=1869338 RepID=UPI002D784ED1|nr:glycosyl transferase family 4 [Dyella sp.]HET6433169.1 glycosyl transferase family 4 [Dyella sp.]